MSDLEERIELLYKSLLATGDHLNRQHKRLEEMRAQLKEEQRLEEEPRINAVPVSARFKTATYAAAALAVLILTVAVPWRRAIARPSFKTPLIIKPLPSVAQPSFISEDETNNEVLSLVYSFIPPGTRRKVQDLLGPDALINAADSPWVFVNVDKQTTLVSIRPDGDDPDSDTVYEFVVDRLARTVSASAETMLNLRTLAVIPSR